MNWIKCTERLPKSGESIVIKQIKIEGKEFKNLVARIDNETAFWLMTHPIEDLFEWKPYIGKEDLAC